MRKIIEGKMYDTDTAKCCGRYSFGEFGDFHYVREELYQKKTGEFFLHGEGSLVSRYHKLDERNMWVGGENIVPLWDDDAKEWAEKHLDVDEYIEIFGPVDE